MRRFIYNNKHRILKLYYQGTPPSVLIHEYRIPSSTLYSWIAKTPKSVVMVSNSNHEIINYYRNKSHCEKIEEELAFLRRTLVKDTPRNAKIAIIDREYGKESLHVQCEALDIINTGMGNCCHRKVMAQRIAYISFPLVTPMAF